MLKRVLDLIFAAVLLIFLSLPMVFIAVLIRLDSSGPAIFKQKRMGKDGESFTIYKFRTMHVTAPSDVATSLLYDRKKHITRVGAFLRRTSLDELPQLLNVVIGDMSLVGCRPLCLTETEINSNRLHDGVLTLRPGITGLAQVKGRDELDDAEKLRYDTEYVSSCSLKTDAYCIWQTVSAVIRCKGAK